MRTLIRFLTRAPGGTVETRDRIVDGDAITLGRATDRTLHLKDVRVALDHARIYRSGGRTLLTCRAPAQAIVNGAVRRDAELHVGDTIQIGSNTLRFIAPPDDSLDLAFTFELDAGVDTRQGVGDRPRLSLGELGLYKRRWAWTLFMVFLGLGLLIPMSGALRKGGSEELRSLHLPSDRIWLSGPLHSAHAVLGGRCEGCHEQLFQPVRSEECLTCHSTNLHRHVTSASSAQGTLSASIRQLECTSCHAEHEEPAQLVQTDQRLCATCHGSDAPVDLRVPRATDFLLDHPDFGDARTSTHDESVGGSAGGSAGAQSGGAETGLLFSHAVHLDAKGVEGPEGNVVMKCADCHQPDDGGGRMRPVRMEDHCASCHRLDFDPADPERAVPHGDPRRVLASLVEYYSARYLAGYPDELASAKPSRVVQLPSIEISRMDRDRLLGVARTRAQATARDLFERRVCIECHNVQRQESSNGTEWSVEKVTRTEAWMPASRFYHSRHGTSLTPCSTCHDAAKSERASDVLMPTIQTCRTCHGGERNHAGASGLIASTCTSCHEFHIDNHPLWEQ